MIRQGLRKIVVEQLPAAIIRVRIRWRFFGQYGDAFLFRRPDDPLPIHLASTGGEIEIDLAEPRSFYVQELDGSSALELKVSPTSRDD
jgi:hypothetical protein